MDTVAEHFREAVISSYHENCPLRFKRDNYKSSWWNKSLKKQRNEVRRTLNRAKESGATNRPDLIDPALLRPGRFDKLLYIGPCTDKESKLSVLKALTRKFSLSNDVNLIEVVKISPKNITGADFYGICSSAWSSAVRRLIKRIENGEIDSEYGQDVIVNFQDFGEAMMNVKPSIKSEDLLYFEKLKRELGSNQ
nr:peroxisome biogenesis protein 6-like [Leptinotarsa decemlineata]